MKEVYIYHHLGLGDHIICNSIVRHFSKLYDVVFLFVKKHNYESVKFMYSDINVNLIVGDDEYANYFIMRNNITNLIKIGFEKLHLSSEKMDKFFYDSVGLDFNKRWDDFYVPRDMNKELNFFKSFNIIENNYVFFHDDISRNLKISEDYIINKELSIVKPDRDLTNNIFDYCYLLENAKEIQCMDSSFRLLCDSINIKSEQNFHHFNRCAPYNLYPSSRKNWKEILM